MEGLQRQLEDLNRARVQKTNPTGVNTGGFFGADLSLSWRGLAVVGSPHHGGFQRREFTNLTIQDPPQDSQSRSGYRSREMEWRRTHAHVLRAYENEWVALEGDEIIAHGRDPVRVFAEAKRRGIDSPYIFYVEPADENVVRMGL
jgi:hypothetical protein